ncbi:MAG TPA: hypothetical protein VF461_20865 [Gemmatimonadaceae bacterium]
MIVPLPALAAYRKDVEQLDSTLPSTSQLDDSLTRWLAFASTLETLATARDQPDGVSALRAQLLATSETILPATTDASTLHATVDGGSAGRVESRATLEVAQLTRRVADTAEQGGALWLATSMLATLERISDELPALEVGRIMTQRARTARKANAADVAEVLYKRVAKLGRVAAEPELIARAAIGFGVLAQFRGNLPLAARHFEKASRMAARVADADLIRLAEQGKMVIAAKRGAFADALRHGWAAFSATTGDRERESETLLNLAQLAFDTGHPRAALHGFAAALERGPGPRLRLPALGGAARAAAALGRKDILNWTADQLDAATPVGSFAYPAASALLDLALAFAVAAPARAQIVAARALELTERFGFHELEHHLRTLQMDIERRMPPAQSAVPALVVVGPKGDEILQYIEQLEGNLLTTTAG